MSVTAKATIQFYGEKDSKGELEFINDSSNGPFIGVKLGTANVVHVRAPDLIFAVKWITGQVR